MKNYAKIIIQSVSDKLDRFFLYSIPDYLVYKLKVGNIVKVNFGNGNKIVYGFVFEILTRDDLCEEDEKYISKIKPIKELEEKFTLNKESMELIKYIRSTYLCSYYEAISLFVPSIFLKNMKLKVKNNLYLNKEIEIPKKYNKEPYISIMKYVDLNRCIYDKNELVKNNNFSKSSIETLIKYGILKIETNDIEIIPQISGKNYEKKVLNYEQEKVYNEVITGENRLFLIHGVTGSGKTEIYLSIFEHFIENGGDCIILLPEISLTPQMIERVKGRFNNKVAIYHSKLSTGERYTQWQNVYQGKVKVAIGTRSALFLPFKNLKCIVVDEEHESSYKSESDPKYEVKDMVVKYSEIKKDLKVVLGSATPSLESYYKAQNNIYKLLEVKNRVNLRPLPETEIINMKEELITGNRSIFSRMLYNKIKDRILKKEQVILFLNKRGYSSFVSCRSCGYVYKCKNCDITLTYHEYNQCLICHYCGYSEKNQTKCISCGSKYVKHFGIGTEKVEEMCIKTFPEAKVLRMDLDTTRKKESYNEIYTKIKNNEVNIIIGTQMVAKGFDFENVTLVGVLAADMSINIPDYRSYERTFQLLNQVSGRAGRGEKLGEVCIQTYEPENYSIVYSKNNDYKSFYDRDIKVRKKLKYPPFIDILIILFQSKNLNFYNDYILEICKKLRKMKILEGYDILGPSTCNISKINQYNRWRIMIKGSRNTEIYNEIKKYIYLMLKKCKIEYKVSFDINPYSMF